MPTYQYACTACGHQLEAVQSFTDAPLTECPACEGRLRKVFNSVGIVFKGSGFYRTDSRSNGSEATAGGSSAPAKTESSSGAGSTGSGSTSSSGNSTSSGRRRPRRATAGPATARGTAAGPATRRSRRRARAAPRAPRPAAPHNRSTPPPRGYPQPAELSTSGVPGAARPVPPHLASCPPERARIVAPRFEREADRWRPNPGRYAESRRWLRPAGRHCPGAVRCSAWPWPRCCSPSPPGCSTPGSRNSPASPARPPHPIPVATRR